MLSIDVHITGTKEAIFKLKALDAGLHDFRKPMKLIGESLKEYFSGPVFTSQGGDLGDSWAKLSEATTRIKLKKYPQYATTPLIRTGLMQKSFKATATMTQVSITNTADYFKYHQSSAARKKIPRRQMMGINDPVKAIIETILIADIDAKMKAA